MKILAFIISMPNCGSWNGKFSGESNFYCNIQKFKEAEYKKDNLCNIVDKSFYYNFGDGWGASIKVELINNKTATQYRKMSRGFMGYEWMIKSIVKNQKIIIEEN
jgi:hypothetical protein